MMVEKPWGLNPVAGKGPGEEAVCELPIRGEVWPA